MAADSVYRITELVGTSTKFWEDASANAVKAASKEFCIAHGIKSFEGGAGGEHKLARGFLPVTTHSAHWLAHPQFARAVEDYLLRETEAISGYVDGLTERSPFK